MGKDRLLKGEVAQLSAENVRNDSFMQRVVLSWVYGIIRRGRKGRLQLDELRMPQTQAAEVASAKFQESWAREVGANPEAPSLLHALWRAFGREFAMAGMFKLFWSTFVILGASFFVNYLIEFVNGRSQDMDMNSIPNKGVGWVLSAAFFVDAWLVGLALQRMGDYSVRVGIKVRAALMTAVYQKTFRINDSGASGSIVGLVSSDCAKMYEGVQHVHNVWTAPIEALTIIGLLLWRTGGVYGLPALGVVLVVLPLQYYFGLRIAHYKIANVEVSDARVLRMHEVLLAIKLVKFYVWERSFARQVEQIRDEELRLIRMSAVVKTLNLCLVFATPPLIALVIFATYAYNVGPLTPQMAFVVLSLFNTLRFPLVVLPKALRGVSEAAASMARLQAFLLLPEAAETHQDGERGAIMDKAELNYGDPTRFTLSVPQFEVRMGQVVAIVGRVGSGKSSVLQALLGKMKLAKGGVSVGGSIAYVPQTPWVQNLTLRDNILFGLPYNEERYRKVVHAAALELDFQILPSGDASMAGERGINLSGGQRQRVCLARAAYHGADIVLLDNPLSAVDQHTSKHIFDTCIKGLLANQAVVLIGHQLELLPQCDAVAVMKDNTMVYFGPYDEEQLALHMPVDAALADATVEGKESVVPAGSKEGESSNDGKGSAERAHGADADDCPQSAEEVAAAFSGVAPRLTAGAATRRYIAAGGWLLGAFSLFIFMFTQTTRIISDWWIRCWASDTPAGFYKEYEAEYGVEEGEYKATTTYLLIYMGLALAFTCLLLCRDTVFSVWSIRGATRLHNRLFRSVLGAPILFFLRTPVGDVLNAFARDQDVMDETLPDTLHMTTIYLMILCTSLAIVTVSINYYAIMTAALFASFAMMQYLYLPAATVLKRWAGETASAVYVLVDESLQGMDVIRAFGAVDYFLQESVHRINTHNLALFNTEQTHLWLAFWCDFFGAILVVATCLFSVAFSATLGAANVGLAISNSIQVLVFFTWVVRGVADSVSMWDAVERATTFAHNVPAEAPPDQAADTLPAPPPADRDASGKAAPAHVALALPWKSGCCGKEDATAGATEVLPVAEVPADWPVTGDVRFEDVCLRYFPGAPLALRHVAFHVRDREKVGIVGRTGSGKTTLLMGLFRLLELARGRIVVDGIDIATLPLREVRRRICIIPQEPVMFKGSVRSNLDPFDAASDNELWHALALVHLRDAVAEMPGGLDAPVSEGGANFSLGQKQLICMARCVLRRSTVLVLDEATAAMDTQTDALIQRTIRRVFAERTTLTIAHRLDTIINSDRILAMSQGQIKEFDTPTALLANPASMFNKLVEDTGPVASAALRRLAVVAAREVGA